MQRIVKCHPYIKRSARQDATWTVPALCAAYQWPSGRAGGGTIAIVELGGGWSKSDMQQYFSNLGQPLPSITDVSVDGTNNTKQNPPNDADMEVALDIQVAGAAYFAATGKPAVIRVYWAQDIAPAVQKAMEDGCDVCSISWGADEAAWGFKACNEMALTATNAVDRGMTIFAASGDNDSSDGGPGKVNVDCPASCPDVFGCGGTRKTLSTETVWNDNPGATNGEGTGGGFSHVFLMPAWQSEQGAPIFHKPAWRMVPDACANADPETGIQIVVYGQVQVAGGTSAVAPLYAGLFASFGKKLGFITKKMWKNQHCFTDILSGSNGLYSARIGPRPLLRESVRPIGVKIAGALF